MTLTLPPRSAAGHGEDQGRNRHLNIQQQLTEEAEKKSAARQHPNGKLTARERITELLDPMS